MDASIRPFPIFAAVLLFCMPVTKACNLPFAPSITEAEKQASDTGKPLLIFFTGSDWSPRSIALDKNIMEHAVIEELIIQSFVPVLVDFPQRVKLTDAARRANLALAERFNVTHFPTVVALRPDGTEIDRLGYGNETVEAVKKLLSQWLKTARDAKSAGK